MKNVLVTGGAGYIGSHLVDELVRRDYVVTVLDSLVPQVHRSGTWPSYANPKARYVQGDVTDRAVFAPLVLESDAVVHFAAAVGVGQSMYEIDRYVNVNTRGTAILLDVMANEKHHLHKVLVASSIGVYGEGAYWCDHCHVPCYPGLRSAAQLAALDWEQRCPKCGHTARAVPTAEDKPLYRDNIYSMTKYHQEEMVLLIGKTYGIPVVAPRFFNVYGPRQSLSNPYAGVAAIFLSRLLNGNSPVLFEDGGQLRDFVSVHDVVDCLVLMLERPGADFLPVNIGSGTRITIREIATTLSGLLGTHIEPTLLNQGRAFDIRHNFADISRAEQALGFAPRVTFEQGMSQLIGWAKLSPDGAVDLFDKAFGELQDKGLVVSTSRSAAPGAAHVVAPTKTLRPAVAPKPAMASPSVAVRPHRATIWTWASYVWALLVALGVGYFIVRGPLQVGDNIGNIVKVSESSLGALLWSEFGSGPYMRPGLWGMFKVAFEASGGAYHATFTGIHAGQIGLLALLFARLLAVRTRTQFLLTPLAFAILLGMHTVGGFVLEAYPINTFTTIAIYVLAALNLSESRGGWWADVAAVVMLTLAMFTIESGLLVWVALATMYLAGARGVSAGGLGSATLVFSAYFVFRFFVAGGGTPGLDERNSGFGFVVLDPDELQARFGANPLIFYLYNIASSLLSVLFSEPRSGLWEFSRHLATSEERFPPWMVLNVGTSVVTTLVIVCYSFRRLSQWMRFRVQPSERLVIAFWGVALANAVISFPYTKDQIVSVAGVLYALAAFVALRDLLDQRWLTKSWLSPAVAMVLLVVACGWTVRSAGLHYNLTLAAYRHRGDWLEVRDWMANQRIEPNTATDALVGQIERESLAMPVPHPYLIYGRWARYFDEH